MAHTIPITVANGDGIGPEIMGATLRILEAAEAPLDIETIDIGERPGTIATEAVERLAVRKRASKVLTIPTGTIGEEGGPDSPPQGQSEPVSPGVEQAFPMLSPAPGVPVCTPDRSVLANLGGKLTIPDIAHPCPADEIQRVVHVLIRMSRGIVEDWHRLTGGMM